MNTSAELARRRLLAKRWGLVSLGALALVTLRFLRALLEDPALLRFEGTPDYLLRARLSQLKPALFKGHPLKIYAVTIVLLVGASIVALLVAGVRDALRPDCDEE